MSSISLYPVNPMNVPSSVTETSISFKKEVSKVLGSIFLFFLVYLLMVVLAVGLVIACVYGGYILIINFPRLITILIGIGMMGLGVMVFIFLIKFIFAVSKFDNSGSIEITESDQPQLFNFIQRLTKDTHTPFPKKIYLSADVNACVFYNSSFWSMFFPVRKNLQIGLGLVNCLNVSEFKAVMAHEFGHFSQRSMKLGSFVYNVNRIIYNMLYENKSYVSSLQRFASASSYFAFFASITVEIVKGIQSVLRGMYGIINKNYMGLSREMEFHADAVAASVSGGNNLVSALKRVDFGSTCYNITLQKCDEILKEKLVSKNIYQNHSAILKKVAEEYKLPLRDGLPAVSEEYLQTHNFSRINFKDQWASHPTTEDREVHLKELNVNVEPDDQPAWVLFRDSSQWQEELTKKIYEKINADGITVIDDQFFESKYQNDVTDFSLPEEYKGFYDGRRITIMQQEVFESFKNKNFQFDTIFSAENIALPKKLDATQNDIELLNAIVAKRIDVKTFDFDGEKYKKEEAASIVANLEKELEDQKKQLSELDKKAIAFFYDEGLKQNSEKGETIKSLYIEYFDSCEQADEFLKFLNLMMDDLGSIYRGETIPVSTIQSIIGNLKNSNEIKFKGYLKQWLALGVFETKSSLKQEVEIFINSNYLYFEGAIFMETELKSLHELVNESWQAVNRWLFLKFKTILETQLPLIKS